MTFPSLGPCTNHPGAAATATCGNCRRPYCSQCLVEFMGQQICGLCKNERLLRAEIGQGYMPEPVSPVPAENWWAVVSVGLTLSALHPCAGFVTAPLALITGIVGLQQCGRTGLQNRRWAALTGISLGGLLTVVYWGWLIVMLTTGQFK